MTITEAVGGGTQPADCENEALSETRRGAPRRVEVRATHDTPTIPADPPASVPRRKRKRKRYASVARFVVAPPTDPIQLEAYERRRTAVARRRVWRLWEAQLGLCRWCGQETYLHGDPRRHRPVTKVLSGKAATYDHLHLKGDPRRYARLNLLKGVMACSTCNGSRKCDAHRAGLAALELRAEVRP